MQDVRFLADVDPCRRVECIGIRGGHALIGSRRVFRDVDEDAHGGTFTVGLDHVCEIAPGQFHRHQRVAVDVSIDGGALGIGGGRLDWRGIGGYAEQQAARKKTASQAMGLHVNAPMLRPIGRPLSVDKWGNAIGW